MAERAAITLGLTEQEAHDVHHALSTTVDLIDAVTAEQGSLAPDAPLAGEARDRLVLIARRLDHERRHRGAVPNPNWVVPGG
jgi:hypothetical protein